jgi:flagellar biosynthesis/type III secretory pathway chaperone
MIEPLKQLIAALREELQSYGEMLALLDQQQHWVFARAADELFQSIGSIQDHALILQEARTRRDDCRRSVAQGFVLPEDTAFATLIPQFPAEYRPLVQALVQENNELLVRVQQRARQNHLLLSRSVELMQRLIATLLPGQDTRVYTDAGRNRPPATASSSVYNAVG